MDSRTGIFYTREQLARIAKQNACFADKIKPFIKPVMVGPTPVQLARIPPRVDRNEPCPCGSDKKFKNCCFAEEGAK